MSTETVSGLRKAAVLLVQLGKERSALVLSQLRDAEVEELSAEIARLESVDGQLADDVMAEFHQLAQAKRYATAGGVGFARDVLEASLGAEKAGEIMDRLTAAMSEMPFKFLRRADARQVLSFLQDEHPQLIALVLSFMGPEQAAIVLSGLASERQADVAHRIATMERSSPEIIQQVESALERRLSSVLVPTEQSAIGGLQPLVDIINRADRTTERLILEGLDERDLALAEQVRSQMFVFENITILDDRSIQLVLRQVETSDLATALKGVREEVREKVMTNLSERAAANLVDEIQMLGPVRLSAVEEAQGKVVQVIRSLEESGQIVIMRGSDDEYVS
jgi:flagellar motor switch protein FliG